MIPVAKCKKCNKISSVDRYCDVCGGELELIIKENKPNNYKLMWGELYGIAEEFNFFPLMDKLEQKYFPKGIIDKAVEGITEQIKEGVEIARKEANK